MGAGRAAGGIVQPQSPSRPGRARAAGGTEFSFRLVHHHLSLGLISKQPVLSFPPNLHMMFQIDVGWSSLSVDAMSGEGLACPPGLEDRRNQGLKQNQPIKILIFPIPVRPTFLEGFTHPKGLWESCFNGSPGRAENRMDVKCLRTSRMTSATTSHTLSATGPVLYFCF